MVPPGDMSHGDLDMFEIEGTSAPGYGKATRSLALVLPLFELDFPEVAGCYRGTINLILDRPLLVVKPDHRSQPLPWDVNYPDYLEGFDFLRIEFEAPLGTAPVRAWLFIPHRAPHRTNLNVHEVIAPKLPVKYGDRCRIRIHRAVEELPYRKIAVVV